MERKKLNLRITLLLVGIFFRILKVEEKKFELRTFVVQRAKK